MRFVGKCGLQECKNNGFLEIGRTGSSFGRVQKNLDILDRRLPLPESSSPEKFMEKLNVLPFSAEIIISPTRACRQHCTAEIGMKGAYTVAT